MRAYSLNRPVGMGTYPKGYAFSEMVNFPRRQPTEEIGGRWAWGYIDFSEDVPVEALKDYEMMTADMVAVNLPNRRLVEKMAKAIIDGDEETVDSMFARFEQSGYDMEALDVELGKIVYREGNGND